jgi:hypothetical protein
MAGPEVRSDVGVTPQMGRLLGARAGLGGEDLNDVETFFRAARGGGEISPSQFEQAKEAMASVTPRSSSPNDPANKLRTAYEDILSEVESRRTRVRSEVASMVTNQDPQTPEEYRAIVDEAIGQDPLGQIMRNELYANVPTDVAATEELRKRLELHRGKLEIEQEMKEEAQAEQVRSGLIREGHTPESASRIQTLADQGVDWAVQAVNRATQRMDQSVEERQKERETRAAAYNMLTGSMGVEADTQRKILQDEGGMSTGAVRVLEADIEPTTEEGAPPVSSVGDYDPHIRQAASATIAMLSTREDMNLQSAARKQVDKLFESGRLVATDEEEEPSKEQITREVMSIAQARAREEQVAANERLQQAAAREFEQVDARLEGMGPLDPESDAATLQGIVSDYGVFDEETGALNPLETAKNYMRAQLVNETLTERQNMWVEAGLENLTAQTSTSPAAAGVYAPLYEKTNELMGSIMQYRVVARAQDERQREARIEKFQAQRAERAGEIAFQRAQRVQQWRGWIRGDTIPLGGEVKVGGFFGGETFGAEDGAIVRPSEFRDLDLEAQVELVEQSRAMFEEYAFREAMPQESIASILDAYDAKLNSLQKNKEEAIQEQARLNYMARLLEEPEQRAISREVEQSIGAVQERELTSELQSAVEYLRDNPDDDAVRRQLEAAGVDTSEIVSEEE